MAPSAAPRLLANENWPRPALLALRAAGFDVQSVAETMPGASDRAVLELACHQGLWIITFDRDYGELVFSQQVEPPPAIVYLRQGAFDPAWPAQAVMELLRDPSFVTGHLVVVAGQTMRRRRLPALHSAPPPTRDP